MNKTYLLGSEIPFFSVSQPMLNLNIFGDDTLVWINELGLMTELVEHFPGFSTKAVVFLSSQGPKVHVFSNWKSAIIRKWGWFFIEVCQCSPDSHQRHGFHVGIHPFTLKHLGINCMSGDILPRVRCHGICCQAASRAG